MEWKADRETGEGRERTEISVCEAMARPKQIAQPQGKARMPKGAGKATAGASEHWAEAGSTEWSFIDAPGHGLCVHDVAEVEHDSLPLDRDLAAVGQPRHDACRVG